MESREERLGHSFYNTSEAKEMKKLLQYLTDGIGRSEHFNREGAVNKSEQKDRYLKSDFWVLSPYAA